jgi:hypothetical protein
MAHTCGPPTIQRAGGEEQGLAPAQAINLQPLSVEVFLLLLF